VDFLLKYKTNEAKPEKLMKTDIACSQQGVEIKNKNKIKEN
jgi:hypothetical protein